MLNYLYISNLFNRIKPFRFDLASTHANDFDDLVKEYAQSLKSAKLRADEYVG